MATSRSSTGTPPGIAMTTVRPKSSTVRAYPRARIMYSAPLNSSSRPPASLLAPRTAATTSISGTFSAASRTGSTVTWNWRA